MAKLASSAAVLLVLLLAACQEQLPIAPPDPGTIRMRLALPDSSLFLDDAAVEHELDAYFTQSAGRTLYYTVRREGEAVSVHASGNRGQYLHLQPEQPGRSEIIVTVTDSIGSRIEEAMQVEVLDDCPQLPGEAESDYFPIREGDDWRFTYLHNYGYPCSFCGGVRQTRGELTWTVTQTTCTSGQRDLQIEEVFEGARWLVDGDRKLEDVTWSRSFSIMQDDTTFRLSAYEGDTLLRRIYPVNAPDTIRQSIVVATANPDDHNGADEVRVEWTLVRDVGLVAYLALPADGRGPGELVGYRRLQRIDVPVGN